MYPYASSVATTCTSCTTPYSASHSPGIFLTTATGPTWICEPCAETQAPRCEACDLPIWPGPQADAAVRVHHHDGHELLHVHNGCAPSHLLLCAWVTWSEYGGPEEGGWQYDAGRLLAAIPVPLEGAANRRTTTAAAVLAADELLANAYRHLAEGDTQLTTTIELDLPEPYFPLKRPHYE